MPNRTPSRFFISLASLTSLTLLVQCSSDPANEPGTDGTPTTTSTAGTATTAGAQTTGQAASAASNGSTGTTQTTSTTGGAQASSAAGSTVTSGTASSTSAGNTTSANTTSTASTTGGVGGGGNTETTTSTTGGPDVDQGGKMNASRGDSTDVPQEYLRLGDIRILNNNWGSEDLGCTAPNSTMNVFVNDSGSFGWNFNRGDCAQAMDTSHPDFPQVEFGIHPFGVGSDLETSPPFTSTTVLPIKIGDIQTATITLENFNIQLNAQDSWNITWEFWLSERHPIDDPSPGVYAEIMGWWGWDAGRWPCDMNGDGMVDYGPRVGGGDKEYTLCHQSDSWASGWRYFQFRAGDGSDGNISTNFSGKVDIKPFIDYLRNEKGYSADLYLTRLEVGSEIDDNTGGTVSIDGITFEINGESRSEVIAE